MAADKLMNPLLLCGNQNSQPGMMHAHSHWLLLWLRKPIAKHISHLLIASLLPVWQLARRNIEMKMRNFFSRHLTVPNTRNFRNFFDCKLAAASCARSHNNYVRFGLYHKQVCHALQIITLKLFFFIFFFVDLRSHEVHCPCPFFFAVNFISQINCTD